MGSLTIFDIDDTLFETTALVYVVKDGVVIDKLTNQEYNVYDLKDGESFDFVEFRDALKFNLESNPIEKMFAKAKIILKNSLSNPMNKVIIITARQNFDNKELFLDTFRKHGFDIDMVRVERAGNILDITSTEMKKFIIIYNYLNTKQFYKVRFFDDMMLNLTTFLKLKAFFPDVIFEAFFVKHDGSIKTIKE